MNDQHKVIVFGGSLFCKGIESSLKRQLDSVVLQIDEAQQDAEEHIHLLCPDVVIVDVVSTRWDVVVATLRKHPETMVIGLDPNKGAGMVLWGVHSSVSSMSELASLVTLHSHSWV